MSDSFGCPSTPTFTLHSSLLLSSLLRSASDATAVRHISPLLNRSEARLPYNYSTMSSGPDDVRSRSQGAVLASQRAKEQSPNSSNQGNRSAFSYFPLGYKDGFRQWWANISPAGAEYTVLSFMPFLRKPLSHTQTASAPGSASSSFVALDRDPLKEPTVVRASSVTDPHGPRSWHSNLIKLSGKNRILNEFFVERDGEEVEENLVMLHGYGAGLGFFYQNFEGISRVPGWRVYALDMLGMGRSSRPPFRVHAKDQQGKIKEAENWFIDSLEEWRKMKKIDKFTLLGHSLGGYMAVAYALKYPGHLKKLILASPVGIPEDPYAVSEDMPEPEESAFASEFTQDQEEIVSRSNLGRGDNNNFLNARSKATNDNKNTNTPPRRPIPKWVAYLWDANISPFSFVRWGGPLGPQLASGWTSRRFSHLPQAEADALHDYSYSLFRQRGSGEYALAYILAPGAFARSPLIGRIQGVGRQPLPAPDPVTNEMKENGIPVVFMYGENDWMDIAGGYAAEEKLKAEKAKALKELSKTKEQKDQGSTKFLIIKKAGHHLYLDAPEEFNDVMRAEMEETKQQGRKQRGQV